MEFHQDLWLQLPASEPRIRPVMERHWVGLSQSGSESFGMPSDFAERLSLGSQHSPGTHSPGGGHPRCLPLVLLMSPTSRSFPVPQRKEKGFTLTGGRARQAQRVLESFPRATVSKWVTYIPRKRWRSREVLLTRLAATGAKPTWILVLRSSPNMWRKTLLLFPAFSPFIVALILWVPKHSRAKTLIGDADR